MPRSRVFWGRWLVVRLYVFPDFLGVYFRVDRLMRFHLGLSILVEVFESAVHVAWFVHPLSVSLDRRTDEMLMISRNPSQAPHHRRRGVENPR